MSTKIYDAYRILDPKNVWKVLWKIEDEARANIDKALRAHYLDLVIKMDPDTEDYKKAWTETRKQFEYYKETSFRLRRAQELVRNSYRDNVTKSHRDTYSLDVSLAVYPHKNDFYLRTFCEPISVVGEALGFVEKMPELEDFHYQNQSDRPENISEKAWKVRAKVWDEILEYEDVGRHVSVDVLCWQNFYRIDPWYDLARNWTKNPPALPIREEVWAASLRELRAFTSVTAEPGRIVANPGNVTIERHYEKSWISTINGAKKEHTTLNRAADHVYFEHLPEDTKEMILGMIERSKQEDERRQALKDELKKAEK